MHSKKTMIDPSVFVAFVDRANSKHEQASAYFRYFAESNYQLFTHIVALTQTYDTLYADISPSLAKDFMRTIVLSNSNILYPDESDFKAAVKTIVGYRSTELTFSKALTAVLANRRNIPQICTFTYMPTLFGIELFYLPL